MVVKAVDLVRKIRDKHYEETKDLSIKEQIKLIKGRSEELQAKLERSQHSPVDNRTPTTKV